MTQPLYTIRKIKKDNTVYGPVHASENGNVTLCNVHLNEHYTILTNTRTGKITCKKCIRNLKHFKVNN